MLDIPHALTVYERVAQRVKDYPYGAGRSRIAADFEITKSTAVEHLEKCVERGLLTKFYGWLSKRSRGWVYIDPAALQEFVPEPDHPWISGVDPADHPDPAFEGDDEPDDLPF
jgi:hypothetical protein